MMTMTDEQLQSIRDRIHTAWDLPGGFDVLYGDAETVVTSDIYDLFDEVQRLQAERAEWDSKEQALQKSIAEHERVIAKIEARYEEQGQYNHQLVRRLTDALEIARAVAEAPIEIVAVGKTEMRALLPRSDVRYVQERARAVLEG